MTVLRQEDSKTRVVQKRHPDFRGSYIVARQRKGMFFWRTTSWLYTNQYGSIEEYIDWFNWDERGRQIGSKQFKTESK